LKQKKFKTAQMARSLGVSDNTIRNFCKEFGDYLSEAAAPTWGTYREFSERDVEILTVISVWRKEGQTYDEIRQRLRRGEHLMERSRLSKNEGSSGHDLLLDQYQKQLDALTNLVLTVHASTQEQVRELQRQLNEANREIGRLQALVDQGGTPQVSRLETLLQRILEKLDEQN
jgi:DNA-binding transcriptional MerR regulator